VLALPVGEMFHTPASGGPAAANAKAAAKAAAATKLEARFMTPSWLAQPRRIPGRTDTVIRPRS